MRTKRHCEDDQNNSLDPECKYLHPSESTEASSSDGGMPQKFDTPSEADIMVEFPQDVLTPEVRTNILNIIENPILNLLRQCNV